jgi:2-methylcitrate dehydratase PrpD
VTGQVTGMARAPDGGAAGGATGTLAAFAAGLSPDGIPPGVLHQARRLLLDTVGCMLGAAGTELGRRNLAWQEVIDAGGDATVVGGTRRASPMVAACVNARLAGALDADETFPSARQTTHHGASTAAAALALGEANGLSGRDLLVALVAGYEVGARISVALIPHEDGSGGLRAGWGPGGVLACAVAAAKLLGLSAPRTAHAMGIAGLHTDTPALQWVQSPVAPMVKTADAGWHAATGLAAASMASVGITGYDRILEGDSGLWRALGYRGFDQDALLGGLGQRWYLLDAAFKPWPCQYWMHYPLTALHELVTGSGLKAAEVERVVLRVDGRCGSAKFRNPEPPGEVDRSFSLPHATAMLLLGIPPGPSWVEDGIAERADVRRLRQLVEVELRSPEDGRVTTVDHIVRAIPTRVVVSTAAGEVERRVDYALGSPWSPRSYATDDALKRKFRDFTAAEPAEADHRIDSEKLIDRLLAIDQEPDVRTVTRLLARPDRGTP